MLQRIRFVSSITIIYVVTIGTIASLVQSSHLIGSPVLAENVQTVVNRTPVKNTSNIIFGKPTRIVISASGIDVPIDDGYYNQNDGSWTLSTSHAQYAVMTPAVNNHAGSTYIYGHGTDAVFGKMGSNPPPNDTIATVYTDNGHKFTYSLSSKHDLQPSDTSILDNTQDGGPQILVQTCTGAFSQWRTVFTFTFDRVT